MTVQETIERTGDGFYDSVRKPRRVGIELEDQAGSDPRWPEGERLPVRTKPRRYPDRLPQERS